MEEQTKVPVFKGALIYGIIVGAVSIVVALILYFIGQSLETWAGIASTAIFLLLIIGSLIMFKKEYGNGFATYGQLVLVSFIVGLVAAILSSLFTLTLYTMDEAYLQDTKYAAIERIDKQLDKMSARYQERFSDEQYEMVEERMKEQRKKGIDKIEEQSPLRLAMSGVFGMVIVSVIIGLIAAIFIRKKPDPTQ
jgi:membrane-bound ClpP family serine protease